MNRGKAAIEFEKPDEADKAVKHMDGGQLDGAFLNVQVSRQSPFNMLALPLLVPISTHSVLSCLKFPICGETDEHPFRFPNILYLLHDHLHLLNPLHLHVIVDVDHIRVLVLDHDLPLVVVVLHHTLVPPHLDEVGMAVVVDIVVGLRLPLVDIVVDLARVVEGVGVMVGEIHMFLVEEEEDMEEEEGTVEEGDMADMEDEVVDRVGLVVVGIDIENVLVHLFEDHQIEVVHEDEVHRMVEEVSRILVQDRGLYPDQGQGRSVAVQVRVGGRGRTREVSRDQGRDRRVVYVVSGWQVRVRAGVLHRKSNRMRAATKR